MWKYIKRGFFFNDFGKTLNVDFLKSWEIQKTWIFLKILEIKKPEFFNNFRNTQTVDFWRPHFLKFWKEL